MNVLAGGPRVADLQVFCKSKEKIGDCSGERAKGGRPETVLRVIGKSKEKIGECSGGRAKDGRSGSLW